MTILAVPVPQAIDTTPWPLEFSFPDLSTLLPFILVCLASLLFTTVWLLAVSRYACKRIARH